MWSQGAEGSGDGKLPRGTAGRGGFLLKAGQVIPPSSSVSGTFRPNDCVERQLSLSYV